MHKKRQRFVFLKFVFLYNIITAHVIKKAVYFIHWHSINVIGVFYDLYDDSWTEFAKSGFGNTVQSPDSAIFFFQNFRVTELIRNNTNGKCVVMHGRKSNVTINICS